LTASIYVGATGRVEDLSWVVRLFARKRGDAKKGMGAENLADFPASIGADVETTAWVVLRYPSVVILSPFNATSRRGPLRQGRSGSSGAAFRANPFT